MEIVQRTILKIFTSFYILTAMLSLVTAAPTPIASTPAAITTSPVGNATMLTLNQSLCPDPETDITAARDSLCHGHLLANGVIENALKVS